MRRASRRPYAGPVSDTLRRRSGLPDKRKSTLSILDDGILVVVAIVGGLLLLKVAGILFGFVVGTVWFLVKLAALVGLVYVVLRAIRNRVR